MVKASTPKKKELKITKRQQQKKDKAFTAQSRSKNQRRKKKNLVVMESVSEKMNDLHIVPWASREEWERVCHLVHRRNWSEVLDELKIWQGRVPCLPLVVESTLFVLQAKLYDQKETSLSQGFSIDMARALYSFAVVRYLNHAGHAAATAIGGTTTMPTKDLTASVGTPDWIVALRNEVTHGAKAPSLESLRLGGNFIVEWLKEHYWKLPNSVDVSQSDVNMTENEENSEDDGLISAFGAARIYKLRQIEIISDYQVTKYLMGKPKKSKTKTVIKELKSKVLAMVRNNWAATCPLLTEAMVPERDFYLDFIEILSNVNSDDFQQLTWIWKPITKAVLQSNAITDLLLKLGEVHISENSDSHKQELSAKWIEMILDALEQAGRLYTKEFLQLLRGVVSRPNVSSKYVFPKLTRILGSRLNSTDLAQLNVLVSIWMDKCCPGGALYEDYMDLFTVDDIPNPNLDNSGAAGSGGGVPQPPQKFPQDSRDSNYWKDVPFGSMLQE